MTRIIEFSAPLGQKAGKGKWNDLDMLEIGNGGMTFDEYGGKTHSLLSVLKSNHFVDSDTLLDVGACQEPTHSWK